MSDLIQRLEEASEGSRELDRDIAKRFDRAEWNKCANWASMPCGAPEEVIDRDALRWLPRYTTSLDAALALAERVLGRVQWAIYTDWPIRTTEPLIDGGWTRTPDTVRGCFVRVFGDPYELRNVDAEALTPPLALCAAILRALQQEDGG